MATSMKFRDAHVVALNFRRTRRRDNRFALAYDIVATRRVPMGAYLYEVLDRLVAFDTVSSNSDVPAMEFVAERLVAHGFNADLHRIEVAGTPQVNLVAWAGPPVSDGLTISGHLDT